MHLTIAHTLRTKLHSDIYSAFIYLPTLLYLYVVEYPILILADIPNRRDKLGPNFEKLQMWHQTEVLDNLDVEQKQKT